jgi:hypothetical protein
MRTGSGCAAALLRTLLHLALRLRLLLLQPCPVQLMWHHSRPLQLLQPV